MLVWTSSAFRLILANSVAELHAGADQRQQVGAVGTFAASFLSLTQLIVCRLRRQAVFSGKAHRLSSSRKVHDTRALQSALTRFVEVSDLIAVFEPQKLRPLMRSKAAFRSR